MTKIQSGSEVVDRLVSQLLKGVDVRQDIDELMLTYEPTLAEEERLGEAVIFLEEERRKRLAATQADKVCEAEANAQPVAETPKVEKDDPARSRRIAGSILRYAGHDLAKTIIDRPVEDVCREDFEILLAAARDKNVAGWVKKKELSPRLNLLSGQQLAEGTFGSLMEEVMNVIELLEGTPDRTRAFEARAALHRARQIRSGIEGREMSTLERLIRYDAGKIPQLEEAACANEAVALALAAAQETEERPATLLLKGMFDSLFAQVDNILESTKPAGTVSRPGPQKTGKTARLKARRPNLETERRERQLARAQKPDNKKK